MLALAGACDLTLSPLEPGPYTDVLETVSFYALSQPTFNLCLANSTSHLAFSLEAISEPVSSNVTIQYLLHRSECLSSPCVQQTLWLKGHFTFQALGTLTFRNVRITGQRLIWDECIEEWCTHQLSIPYIWPEIMEFTLIDHHPAPNASDPFYQPFMVGDSSFNFFVVEGSLMVIDNCTIDNIRIRASTFIFLQQALLTITNTNIINMDFSYSFITGSSPNAHLSDLYVTGFNRDRPFYSNYYDYDTCFFDLSISHLTLINSLFENNIHLTVNELTFFKITNYNSIVFDTCVFRNSIQSFGFYNEIISGSSLVIRKCHFEGDFSKSYWGYLRVSSSIGKAEVHIVDSVFRNLTSRDKGIFEFDMDEIAGIVEITGTTFSNNQIYTIIEPEEPPHLYGILAGISTIENSTFEVFTEETQSLMVALIFKGLMNNSTDVYENFVIRQFSACPSVLYIERWADVRLRNISFSENSICTVLVLFSQTTHTTLRLTAEQLEVRTAGGLRFTDKPHAMFHFELSNSTFETISEAPIILNYTSTSSIELIVSDCKFIGNGIVFIGASLEVSNSRFVNISSEYGALDFLIRYSGKDESIASLLIHNSSFVTNKGTIAADIGLRSEYLHTSLNLSIRGCNFSHFSGTSGGSIYIQEQWLNAALIESCRFTGGPVSIKNGVIMTSHSKGTLNLDNVLFDSIHNPNSYVIQVTSSSIPFLDRQTLTNLTRVTILNCTYEAAVSLKGKYWMTWLHSYQCRFA